MYIRRMSHATTPRQAILTSVIELAEHHGIHGMQDNELAEALELTPAALYKYFPDRSSLETAISEEVARRLYGSLRQVAETSDPKQAIRNMSVVFLEFVRDHRKLYELVLLRFIARADNAAFRALRSFVITQVTLVTGIPQSRDAATALWAHLHGVAALQAAHSGDDELYSKALEFGLGGWFQAAESAAHW